MAKRSRFADAFEEGTYEYERLHVDPTALNHASEIMKRLRRSNGFFGSQFDWHDKACPSYRVRLVYNPSQAKADERALERAIETRDTLKPAADALHKIWELVSYQLKACEEDIEAYHNRRGFFSLPDEILSTVLEYAALTRIWKDWKKETISIVKAATKLSHVCKRFRDLITHSPRLWQDVFNGMESADMVSTCMSRCRRANAEVSLTASFFPALGFLSGVNRHENTSFIQAVMERPENWRSFTLNNRSDNSYEDFEDGQLRELAELTKGVDLPNLSKLANYYPQIVLSTELQSDEKVREILHYYSSWTTPKLRSITAHNFVPVPFSGSLSLTSLHVTLHFRRYRDDEESKLDVKSLLSLLSGCPSLIDFALKVHDVKGATLPIISGHRTEMLCVKQLELEFSDCHSTPLKYLFDAVRFPHVTSMQLKISSEEDEKRVDMHFVDIFHAVLPNADVFPKLVDMHLHVYAEDTGEKETNTRGPISIPFAVMPKLRSFELQTLLIAIRCIPDGVALPAIRTLVLKDCYRLEKDWLVHVLRQLNAQGDLDLLRVSFAGNCRPLKKLGIEGSLSKEDILKLQVIA